MRVTNQQMYQQVLREVQRHLSDSARAQEQVATGRRFTRLSEDPVAGAQVLRSDQTLRAAAQYRRAVTAVRTRQDTAEAALDQITELLTRAKELATAQVGSNANGSSRAATAVEVDRLLEQTIALGNSRVGNEFIFGGTATGAPAFLANGTYSGTPTSRQAEISAGHLVEMAPTGQAVLIDTGVITALQALSQGLHSNDTTIITTSLGTLETAFDGVQSELAKVGARGRELEGTLSELDALTTITEMARSDAADIPLEEAATHLAAVQAALQAAIMTGTRLLESTLQNYR